MLHSGRLLPCVVVSVALGVPAAEPAKAGPDATASRFLSDTVSMMDWGIFRLEQSLDDSPLGPVLVSYDWDRNRIVVQKWDMPQVELSQDMMQATCRQWMDQLRARALVDPATGQLYTGVEQSAFAYHFGHSGFSRTVGGQEEAAGLRALDRIFEVRYRFFLPDGDMVSDLSCFGDLLSKRVAFEFQ